jgi:SAM-dependent methyltransferase
MPARQFWDQHVLQDAVLNPYYQKFVDFAINPALAGRPLHVLELGCGNGLLAIQIARQYGFSVIGVDFSSRSIDWANRQAQASGEKRVSFQCGDVRDPDLPLVGPFDIIIGTAVLHEVTGPDFEALARRLFCLLSPAGYGVFLENSFFNPLFRFVRAAMPDHLRLGHPEEYPFDPQRYRVLQSIFTLTRRDCIGVMLLHRFHAQLLSKLIDHVIISRAFDTLDYWATRYLPASWALWLSYLQVISFFKKSDSLDVLNFDVISRPWMPRYEPLGPNQQ